MAQDSIARALAVSANDGLITVNQRIDALPHGMQYKGVVLYYDLLPTTGVEIGDMYTIKYVGTSQEAGTTVWGAEVVYASNTAPYYEEVGIATQATVAGTNLVLGQAVGTVVDTTLIF